MNRTTILMLTLTLLALIVLGMIGNTIAAEITDAFAPLTAR